MGVVFQLRTSGSSRGRPCEHRRIMVLDHRVLLGGVVQVAVVADLEEGRGIDAHVCFSQTLSQSLICSCSCFGVCCQPICVLPSREHAGRYASCAVGSCTCME